MEFAWVITLVVILVIASFWVMIAVDRRDARKAASQAAAAPSASAAPKPAAPAADATRVEAPPPAAAATFDEPDGLKIFGWILFLTGASLLVAAFAVSSSVDVSASSSLLGGYSGLMPDRVANMDKMNLKLMLAVAGGATMICGSIFIARK